MDYQLIFRKRKNKTRLEDIRFVQEVDDKNLFFKRRKNKDEKKL